MPLLDQLTKRVADYLPSVISPTGHAVADYATAAGFLAFGAWAWRHRRHAALASILCGTFQVGVALMTDYPGGITKHISFRSHGRIDVGFAAMVGTMPDYMGFKDADEARFFRMQAIALAAVTGLTDFTGTGKSRQLRHLEDAA